MPEHSPATPQRRPNVILITTDQQRGDCMGYGPRGVRTPHLDRLAGRGTRFDTCITPNPMCQVARASILTGKLPYHHGVRDNGYDLDPKHGAEGLGGVFSGAGYRTHFIGKAHFGTHKTFEPTGGPECYSSAADYPGTWTGPYFGFERADLTLRPHHHTAWAEPPEALQYETWLDSDHKGRERWERAKEQTEPKTKHRQVWRSALEEPWHSTAWCGDLAVNAVRDADEQPFFIWLSFPDPHPPFMAPEPWSSTYDPKTVDLPVHRTRDFEKRPWWHRLFYEAKLERARKNTGDLNVSEDFDDDDLKHITAVYYGMIEAVDSQVGRLLSALDEKGCLDETIIVFTSDHGEWLGDHGLILKGPMLYDGLLRVPCILAGPGIPENRVITAPVSTLDLRSTLADLAGIEAGEDDGESWKPLLDGSSTRKFAYGEWSVEADRLGIDLDLRTVRTRRYRLSCDLLSCAGELYDLKNDPDEMTNLFDDPAAAATRQELMAMISTRKPVPEQTQKRVGWH